MDEEVELREVRELVGMWQTETGIETWSFWLPLKLLATVSDCLLV